MQKHLEIRDFIYLDIERVRSLLAQMTGGLTSEKNTETSRTIGGEGGLEGGIPLFGKANASTDYHFMRSGSETKSLHDHIFAEFYDYLQKNSLITDIRAFTESDWTTDKFSDSQFIIAQGVLKFIDYQTMAKIAQSLPNLADLVTRITSSSGNNSNIERQNKDLKTQLKSLPMKDIASFIEQMYSDGIRIKLFPFPTNPSMVLIGSAIREYFRYAPNTIASIYGSVVDANWQCVLQVNKGHSFASGELLTKSGNALEDALENVFDHIANISTVTQGIKFPAISVTPIAVLRNIYRE